jgi:hypothetical protein
LKKTKTKIENLQREKDQIGNLKKETEFDNNAQTKKTKNPIEQLTSIIKTFLDQHCDIVDADPGDQQANLFNLLQHLFSFENEMKM